ncbi:MAG: hypothetical protein HYW50_05385, partial [Candidatus Diapherotrites archaeon]|nr:hypothetical protein [Candidatus Diapherotrites archaeon]
MKKILSAIFLVFFASNVFSFELESALEQTKFFGAQYEDGTINYLQLKIYMNSLKERVYKEFFGENFFEQGQQSEKDLQLFNIFEQAEKSYHSGNFEELERLFDLAEAELINRGNSEGVKILNGIRKAVEEKDERKIEELAQQLDSLFREQKRQEEFAGWPMEKVEELFGKPTSFQDRVWVENLKRDVKIARPVPAWQKKVFDGKKITIALNAWPHLTEYSDGVVAYYWVDFDTSFKKEIIAVDKDAFLSEVKQKIESFYETGGGGQELAEFLVENERTFNQLIEQNKTECLQTILEFFDKPKGNSTKIRWSGTIASSAEKEAVWFLDEMINEEWHGFHSWIEIMPFRPQTEPEFESFDKELVFNQTVEQNIQDFRSLVSTIKQNAVAGDTAGLIEKKYLLNEYLSVLTEKANGENFSFTIAELESLLEYLFNEHTTNFVKEQISATDFMETLFKVSEKKVNSFCRGESAWCGEGNSCFNAQCVSTKGGSESCDNGIDDDSDNTLDCEDPDCIEFLECGRACEPLCNQDNGCWQCSAENCREQCDVYGKCQESNKDNKGYCDEICEPCGNCTNSFCAQ